MKKYIYNIYISPYNILSNMMLNMMFLPVISQVSDQCLVGVLTDVLEKTGRGFPFLPGAGNQEVNNRSSVCVCVC